MSKMKVKDLIEELKKFDGNMGVEFYGEAEHLYCDEIKLVKKVRGYAHWKEGGLMGSTMFDTLEEAKKVAEEKNRLNPIYKDVLVIVTDR